MSAYSPYTFSPYSEESSPAPFSPASSVSSVSAMSTTDSLSSDSSPVPSPASPPQQDEPEKNYPRYRNIYEERLQPLSAYQTLPSSQPLPKATHRSDYNPQLQARFDAAVRRGSFQELDEFLSSYSELVNINQFDVDGHTPLQHFCSLGNLKMVQLMVRFGADPRMTSKDGWATIHIATWSGNSEVMMYILRCTKR